MKTLRLLGAICAIHMCLLFAADGMAASTPLKYVLDGTFGSVWLPEGFTGPGPFDNRDFTITWIVPDPSTPDDPLGTTYYVDANLTIDGIGTFNQPVAWNLLTYAFGYGIVSFQNILEPNDNIAFGICTGGISDSSLCPVLWNRDTSNTILFTGTFPLGPDLFCSTPPCNSTFGNYFYPNTSGGFDGISTLFSGTLTFSEVPLLPSLWLFGAGLLGLIGIARHKNVD